MKFEYLYIPSQISNDLYANWREIRVLLLRVYAFLYISYKFNQLIYKAV